jgi:hypothetical protein
MPTKTRKNLIGKLHKGELSSLGYSTTKSAVARHRALNKATRKYGTLSIYRKLNAVAVLSKNTNPETSKIMLEDRNWIGLQNGYKSS